MWAPRNQADFNYVQTLGGEFYLGIYNDESTSTWRYSSDDSAYKNWLTNWSGKTAKSGDICVKREKSGTWRGDACDHCHEYLCDIPGVTDDQCANFPDNVDVQGGTITITPEDPCGEQFTCKNTVGSFKCNCPAGFVKLLDQCVDKNECDNLTKCDINAACSNTVGSFSCECNTGFTGNGDQCNDINECLQEPCDQNAQCENNAGSFECECLIGYTGNGFECTDVDECTNDNLNNCDENAECENLPGAFECNCNTGYSGNGSSCDDINECINENDNNCDENAECANTPGSFECTCSTGFVESGIDGTCKPDTCNPSCSGDAVCNENMECECNAGFTGNGIECVDVNECVIGVHTCHSRANCYNIPASYACICHPGFEGDGESCVDINECVTQLHDCPNHSTCQNVVGNYHCTCDLGFESVNDVCIDINECLIEGDNCSTNATCTNTMGSYTCDCHEGYAGDGFTCMPNDPSCGTCGINAHCIILRKWSGRKLRKLPECNCIPGFTGDPSVECIDIDECNDDLFDMTCGSHSVCHNTVGSAECLCQSGFVNDATGKCIDINECDSGSHMCHEDAQCHNYEGGYNCLCNTGYHGNGLNCIEIDECATEVHSCSADGKCFNTDGSYTCECNEGFNGNGHQCITEELCLEDCGTHGLCLNGECVCQNGFVIDISGLCQDVDECEPSQCILPNTICINFPGGFDCICEQGFSMNDDEECVDINECTSGTHSCSENAFCIDLHGLHSCSCKSGFSGNGLICEEDDDTTDTCTCGEALCDEENICICPSGYSFNENGMTCDDVNECADEIHDCGTHAKCLNFEGSFTCICFNGYDYVQDSETECQDIDECERELDICSINSECINFDGGYNCHCENGFEGNGLICNDVDECSGVNDCSDHAICSNTEGSFACSCLDGFSDLLESHPGRLCHQDGEPCLDNTHQCSDNAVCSTTSTRHGVEETYSCTCVTGFTGNGFECIDDDECDQFTHSCTENQECLNTVGSYKCTCPEGMTGDGHVCIDTDECVDGTHQCTTHSTCHNTVGDYVCVCDLGFGGNMCSDVNECDLNTNNCHWNATCHNNVGSYTCSCNEDTFGDGFVCTDVNGTDSHNGNNPLVFGDPHFVFNSVDNERICFNYDGDLEHPMLLVADPVSGLYITGILQRAGKAKAFREIQILTPNGISASVTKSHITVIKGGKILLTKDSNELHAKEELYEDDLYISRHPRTRDWDIRIGGDIHLHVINKHVSIGPDR